MLKFKLSKSKILISLVALIAIILLVFFIIFDGKKLNVSNLSELENYSNVYVGDASKVGAILNLLPYSDTKQGISIKSDSEPYGLTINYDKNLNRQKLEYNSLVLFSIITNLDTINYNLPDDKTIIVKRAEYASLIDLNLNSIKEHMNNVLNFGESSAYDVTINKDGNIVFLNPNLALKQLKIDYKEELNLIKSEFKLLPLNKYNYDKYKDNAMQVISADNNIHVRSKLVNKFLQIYGEKSGYVANAFNVEKYPMSEINHKALAVENDVFSLGIVANNILSQYFQNFYGEEIDDYQELSNFVPMSDKVIAGDINEFVVIVDYKLGCKYPKLISYWGEVNSENMVAGKVMLRIKKYDNEKTQNDSKYVEYRLEKIGDNVSTEGLKEVTNAYVEEKSY